MSKSCQQMNLYDDDNEEDICVSISKAKKHKNDKNFTKKINKSFLQLTIRYLQQYLIRDLLQLPLTPAYNVIGIRSVNYVMLALIIK